MNDVEGKEITFDQLVFSDKERNRILLDLDKTVDPTALEIDRRTKYRLFDRLTRLFSRHFAKG